MKEAHKHTSSLPSLLVFVALCLAISAIGGAVTATSVGDWYPTLAKPVFTPPDWLFAPVWSTLYVLIALSGWRVWRRVDAPRRRQALAPYVLQLTLNLAWSLLFFGLRWPSAGLVCIVLLLAAIACNLIAFWRIDRLAGLLLAPYLAWVGFATALNAAIWWMN